MTDWVWRRLMGAEPVPYPWNYRNLPPILEHVDEPEAFSMTFLSHVDNCPRSGFLYRKHRRAAGSHPMFRGTLAHMIFAELTQALIDNAEPFLPADVAKAITREQMDKHPELVLRHEDRDDARIMAFHWSQGVAIDPQTVGGIEKHLELVLPSGQKVHGVADLILLFPEKRHAVVRDYKTSFNVPAQRAFERSFQTRFYGGLLFFGKGPDDPVGLGEGLETVELEEVYPRYLFNDGLLTRRVTLERADLTDFMGDVENVVEVARRGFREHRWQAVTSSHCAICPAAEECPLPRVLLDGYFEGEWKIADDPVRAAELAYHLTRQRDGVMKGLRAYSKEHGDIYYGPVEPGKPGRVYGPVVRATSKVKSVPLGKGAKLEGKKALEFYIERAKVEGTAFKLDECYVESTPTRFEDRKHEPDEIGEDGYGGF